MWPELLVCWLLLQHITAGFIESSLVTKVMTRTLEMHDFMIWEKGSRQDDAWFMMSDHEDNAAAHNDDNDDDGEDDDDDDDGWSRWWWWWWCRRWWRWLQQRWIKIHQWCTWNIFMNISEFVADIYIYIHIFYYIFPDSMLQGKTQQKGWEVRSSSTSIIWLALLASPGIRLTYLWGPIMSLPKPCSSLGQEAPLLDQWRTLGWQNKHSCRAMVEAKLKLCQKLQEFIVTPCKSWIASIL